jgi:hypothetical protein
MRRGGGRAEGIVTGRWPGRTVGGHRTASSLARGTTRHFCEYPFRSSHRTMRRKVRGCRYPDSDIISGALGSVYGASDRYAWLCQAWRNAALGVETCAHA